MVKWIRLIWFIRKHRGKGMHSFHLIATGSEIIVTTRSVLGEQMDYEHEQIRFNYTGFDVVVNRGSTL